MVVVTNGQTVADAERESLERVLSNTPKPRKLSAEEEYRASRKLFLVARKTKQSILIKKLRNKK